ncbi:chemotaxis protein CheW [Serpentinicella alkaliphila]|uniref:Chemotaxis protein CheW n=1 Tax=Serpentinicella alkaliphila TaxID=1734049 RepID=A0A4R2TSV3_9FIRM|nr:chemotaxis protein CheW [Serpentinicella alkaliphila]QUH26302.1 chemotaxis protein CheW [Serpentinicella alkaliphila]TCQ05882.1 purine-binding chemotaxis protein CheW [Serpentinicella alkaliphila]
MSNNNGTTNQYVVFNLENEYYGVNINYVETIEKVSAITRVPKAPYYVKGVINLRGEVVPVIDIRKRFNLPDSDITDNTRIIILSVEEMIMGIIVDSSSEVITISKDLIENTSNLINSSEDDYINGIGKIENRMIILLDVHKIFDLKAS